MGSGKSSDGPIYSINNGAISRNLFENIKLIEHLYKSMQKVVLLATVRSIQTFMEMLQHFSLTTGPVTGKGPPLISSIFGISECSPKR